MTLFENEYVKIGLDQSVPCIEWIGKQYMPSADFRQSQEKLLQLYRALKKTHATLHSYIDARLIGVIAPKDTQWTADEILPLAVEAGLQKEAFVVAEGLSKLTVTHYKTAAGKIIELAMFNTPEAAKTWLKESPTLQHDAVLRPK